VYFQHPITCSHFLDRCFGYELLAYIVCFGTLLDRCFGYFKRMPHLKLWFQWICYGSLSIGRYGDILAEIIMVDYTSIQIAETDNIGQQFIIANICLRVSRNRQYRPIIHYSKHLSKSVPKQTIYANNSL
jgi:hypothetical protein